MKWIKGKPTKNGFYWAVDFGYVFMVSVVDGMAVARDDTGGAFEPHNITHYAHIKKPEAPS